MTRAITPILADLRVVEVSAFVAAPLGGMTLAQMGADVLRIDDIRGALDGQRWPVSQNGTSFFWAGLNKGKRSVALDLRSEEGREIAAALATAPGPGGGIVLTNFPPRGWLSYDALKSKRGLTGPADAPVNHVLPAWDLVTGQMAALGLLAAERHRARTGAGQQVTLALEDVALAVMGHLGFIGEAAYGTERPASGNDLFGAFGRDFATADGGRIMVVGLTGRQWSALVETTGIAAGLAGIERQRGLDFAREGDRYLARDAIADLIAPWFAARGTEMACAALTAGEVCFGRYQSVRQMVAVDTACSSANPLFTELEQPGIGPLLTPGLPLRFGGSGNLAAVPAPRPGADTASVLGDLLGITGAAYDRLTDRGVVPPPPASA